MITKKTKDFYIALIACMSALGGILYGYDIGVISGSLPSIIANSSVTLKEGEFIVGILFLGIILGSVSSAFLSDIYGRKGCLLIACFIAFIALSLIYFGTTVVMLSLMRFSLGVSMGMISVSIPLYIAEFSPHELRGRLVVVFQLCVTLGILISYVSSYIFIDLCKMAWQYTYYALYVVLFMQLVTYKFLPESPKWLISNKKRVHESMDLLRLMNPEDEISSKETENKDKNVNYFSTTFFVSLIVPVTLAVLQQLSGINIFLQYLLVILNKAGSLGAEGVASKIPIFIGILNLILTVVSIFLVDRIGRVILLKLGLLGMSFSLFVLILCHLMLGTSPILLYSTGACIAIFIASYALGPGAMIFLILSEFFPTPYRSKGLSICLVMNSISAMIISGRFFTIIDLIGMLGIFVIFLFCALLYFVIVKYSMVEKKGVKLD